MRKTLNTPPKCWGVVRRIVKDWLDEKEEGDSVEKEEEVKTWVEKDYLAPNMVKPFRKALRHIDEKMEKDLGEEVEAFEYWTAGPVGIASVGQYVGTEVYGVPDEAVERMKRGSSSRELHFNNPARWS